MIGVRRTSATKRVRVAGALMLFGLTCACGVDAGAPQRITRGDAELYAGYVQPYVEANCASLDCHGVPGRPLRLYSELGLRREPALRATPVAAGSEPAPITREELDDNQLAFAAIAAGTEPPTAQLALRKPLALSAGGFSHEGGVHWPTREDAGYQCLRGYLVGDVADVAAVCAQALARTTP